MWSVKWCHFQWPWTNPKHVCKVTPFFDAECLTNRYRYGHSYYRRRIENRTKAFEWHQFQWLEWPQPTFQGHDNISLFKFDKWIDYGKSHRSGEKFPRKGYGVDHVTLLKILTPSIFLAWMKLHSLNLASGSTIRQVPPGVKNFSPKGAWSGSRDRFWNFKPLQYFLNGWRYAV